MDKTQERVTTVLTRMLALVKEDEDFAEGMTDDLDDMLNNIQGMDGFGTEAQCDPRGDFREGDWSMDCVEGVDS